MVESEKKVAHERTSFRHDYFNKLVLIVILNLATLVFIALTVVYIVSHPARDVSLKAGVVSNGGYQSWRLFSVPDSVNKPVFTDAEVLQWTADNLHRAFDINKYTGAWRKDGAIVTPSSSIARVFTTAGLKTYSAALTMDDMYSRMIVNDNVLSLQFRGQAPSLTDEGRLHNASKRFYWKFQVPVVISSNVTGTSVVNVGNYIVSVTVVREAATVRSARLAIDRISLLEV